MRFVHTSDWHIGRTIKGQERWEEVSTLLDELALFVERERIELVLVSGDVFDVLTPPAEAERIVYEFFCRMNSMKVPVIVIAGNHDSPQRFDSRTGLFAIAGVYVVGRARHDAIFRPIVRSGADVLVGALPFVSEKSVIKGIDYMMKSETELKGSYTERIETMIKKLSEQFRPESINILMTHLFFEGSIPSYSERQIDLTNSYAVHTSAIPPNLNYLAVGHIHKQQRIKRTGVNAYYSGSLMKLDFGEERDEKGFLLVDAKPNTPPQVEHIKLSGVRNLMTFELDYNELPAQAEQINERLGKKGYARVRIRHDQPIVHLGELVRQHIPNAVDWEMLIDRPQQEKRWSIDHQLIADPIEMYRSFYKDVLGTEPAEDVLNAMKSLFDEVSRETD